MPLISRAVWARCCVACLVELNAALQQRSCLMELADLPKHFLSRSGAQYVWVAGVTRAKFIITPVFEPASMVVVCVHPDGTNMICRFLHRGAEDDNAAVATNITKIVHWSRAGVNSSVSHGQMPSDKLQWWRRSFQQLLFGNWKLFHPVPLISLAVWARCCVACLVELKAALQRGSRLLKLANLPKHFLSRSGAQCVWVAGEGSGHGKPKTLTGLHVVFRGKSVVRGFRYAWTAPVFVQGCFRVFSGPQKLAPGNPYEVLSAFVVRGFRNAISFKSTDLCYVGSCSCSGVDFVCVSGPMTSPGNPNGGPCSRRSRISDCVVCRKDGSLYIGHNFATCDRVAIWRLWDHKRQVHGVAPCSGVGCTLVLISCGW